MMQTRGEKVKRHGAGKQQAGWRADAGRLPDLQSDAHQLKQRCTSSHNRHGQGERPTKEASARVKVKLTLSPLPPACSARCAIMASSPDWKRPHQKTAGRHTCSEERLDSVWWPPAEEAASSGHCDARPMGHSTVRGAHLLFITASARTWLGCGGGRARLS